MKGIVRPKMTELPESAQVPAGNLRRPPARLTHRVTARQPYYYAPDASREADGVFDAGTRVALRSEDGALCGVVDARGLFVYVACSGLERLPLRRRAQKR